jgi:hypothetical protein
MKRYKRKIFEDGFILEEMAMLDGFIQFISKNKKDFDIKSDNFVNQKGWESFKKFLKECMKYYQKRSSLDSYSKILEKEKIIYDKEWNNLDAEEQNKIELLAKKIDTMKI